MKVYETRQNSVRALSQNQENRLDRSDRTLTKNQCGSFSCVKHELLFMFTDRCLKVNKRLI